MFDCWTKMYDILYGTMACFIDTILVAAGTRRYNRTSNSNPSSCCFRIQIMGFKEVKLSLQSKIKSHRWKSPKTRVDHWNSLTSQLSLLKLMSLGTNLKCMFNLCRLFQVVEHVTCCELGSFSSLWLEIEF